MSKFVLRAVFVFILSVGFVTQHPKATYAILSLDIDSNCKNVSPYIYGFSSNGYKQLLSKDDFTTQYNSHGQLTELKPNIIRFPGGCPGDSYNYHTSKMEYQSLLNGGPATKEFLSIDEMLSAAGDAGSQIIYQVNIDATKTRNPCGDISAYPNLGSYEANLNQLITDAKDIVSTYGTRIYLYELGNEQWGNMQGPQYAQIALQFAKAMKSVNPNINIGLIGYPAWGLNQSQEIAWDNAILAIKDTSCGQTNCFTHVTDHPYADTPSVSNGGLLVTEIQKYKIAFQKRIADFYPLKLAITEWNINNCWSTTTPPFRAQEQLMYSIKSLLTMAEAGVDIATYHDMGRGNNSCAVFQSTDGNATINTKSLYLFGQIQPRFFKTIRSGNNNIASYGIEGKDGKLYIFLLNESNISETIPNLSISDGLQIVGNSFSDQNPIFSNLGNQSSLNLPPYSITRVTLTQNPSSCIPTPTLIPTTPPTKCASSSVSSTSLDMRSIGNTVTVTAIIDNPINSYGKFAIYNLDNLYSANNPKPALLPSNGALKSSANGIDPSYQDSPAVINLSPTQKEFIWTIKAGDLDTVDQATNKKINNIQLNIYAGNSVVQDMQNCIQKLNLSRPSITSQGEPCTDGAVCSWSTPDSGVRICKNGFIDRSWSMYPNHNCNLQKRVVRTIDGLEKDVSYMYGPPLNKPAIVPENITCNSIAWHRPDNANNSPVSYVLMINDKSSNINYLPDHSNPNYDPKDQWLQITSSPQDTIITKNVTLTPDVNYDISIQPSYLGEPYEKWSRHFINSYTFTANCGQAGEIFRVDSDKQINILSNDLNSDGLITLDDFLVWKQSYLKTQTTINGFLSWKSAYKQ